MVERGGLENRCACKRTVGSNPTPTATQAGLKKSQWFYITIEEERVTMAGRPGVVPARLLAW